MFRAITFEAEAGRFQAAGIRLGADQTAVETRLMEEVLNPFPVVLRGQATRMTRLYALLFCFENSVRQLIRDRMLERHGPNWWETKSPKSVRDYSNKIQNGISENTWLEGEKGDNLQFVSFGHLADIITNCWEDFSDLMPTQHFIRQRMDELEKARNFIAHNRMLLDAEFQRIEMYILDWNKQVGF